MKYLIRAIVFPFLLIAWLLNHVYFGMWHQFSQPFWESDEWEIKTSWIIAFILAMAAITVVIPLFLVLLTGNWKMMFFCFLIGIPFFVSAPMGFIDGDYPREQWDYWSFENVMHIVFSEYKKPEIEPELSKEEQIALKELDKEFPGVIKKNEL